MAELTKLTGTYIKSGSIPTTALSGGVVSSSLQVVASLPTGSVSSSAQVAALLPTDVVSSSAQVTAFLPQNTVSSSGQVKTFLPDGTVSSSTQYPGWVTSSTQVDYSQLQNIPSGIASSSAQIKAYLPSDTVSSSQQVTGFLPVGTVSGSGQINVFNTIGGNTLATTGSNTFTGIQTVSDTTDSTNYLDGALHVAGGMSVRKDVRISGSMTVNGLLTAVSMSTQYVTSSQYVVGDNKIILSADDVTRFGGMSIVDSGSSSPTTASIYWDSLQHRFIYENLSGSAYNSAIIIAGPKNVGALGDEATLTSGYLPYATGADHIDNSVTFQSSSNIGIGTTTPAGTLAIKTVSSEGSNILDWTKHIVIGPNAGSSTGANLGIGYNTGQDRAEIVSIAPGIAWKRLAVYSSGIDFYTNDGNFTTTINSSGNVGIGTTNPSSKLEVSNSNIIISSLGSSANSTFKGVSINTADLGGSTGNAGVYLSAPYGGGTTNQAFFRVKRGASDTYNGSEIAFNNRFRFLGSTTEDTSERLRIDEYGNIGVGTTNPGYKLDVYTVGGSVATTRLYGNDQTNVRLRLENIGTGGRTWELVGGLPASNNSNFSLYDVTAAATRLTVDVSGSMGVGNVNPAAYGGFVVQVASGVGLHSNTVSGAAGVSLYENGTGRFSLQTLNGSAGLQFYDSFNGVERMRIDATGSVGIGTTSPRGKLDVAMASNYGTDYLVIGTTSPNVTSYPSAPFSSAASILMKGSTSDARLQIQDGTGRINLLWNAYTSASVHYYTVTNELVGRMLITPSVTSAYWSYYGAPAGTAGQPITWIQSAVIEPSSSVWFSPRGTSSDFFINMSGNVGIGTTNPVYKLDVFTSNTNDGAQIRIKNTNATTTANAVVNIDGYGASELKIWRNGIEEWKLERVQSTDDLQLNAYGGAVGGGAGVGVVQFWDYDTGNVGIGTTSPTYKLVVSNGGANGLEIDPANASGTQTAILSYNRSTAAYTPLVIQGLGITLGHPNYPFKMTTSGSFGIGTSAPQTQLEVTDITSYGGSQYGGRKYITLGRNEPDRYNAYLGFGDWAGGNKFGLRLGTRNNNVDYDAITIVDGNVGIGTVSPPTKLSISDGAAMYAAQEGTFLDIRRGANNGNDTTSRVGLRLANNANGFQMYYGGTSDRLRFVDGGDVEVMSLKNGGNVGIGTTNPGYKLHVSGDIVNTTNVNSTGDPGISMPSGHRIGFDQSGTRSWSVKATGGNLQFFSGDENGYHVFSSAGVGIGTTNPGSHKLRVEGSVVATSGWKGTASAAGALGGVVQSFACERNGTGAAGQVLSFGNGSSAGKGIRMPFAGKLIAATLSAIGINGTINLDVIQNGSVNTSYRLTAFDASAVSDQGDTKDFSASPLSFAAGDNLGWYVTSAPSTATAYNVTFYVVFD